MWTPIIGKMQAKNDRERLERAEDNIWRLKEIVEILEKRIEELEKKNDEEKTA